MSTEPSGSALSSHRCLFTQREQSFCYCCSLCCTGRQRQPPELTFKPLVSCLADQDTARHVDVCHSCSLLRHAERKKCATCSCRLIYYLFIKMRHGIRFNIAFTESRGEHGSSKHRMKSFSFSACVCICILYIWTLVCEMSEYLSLSKASCLFTLVIFNGKNIHLFLTCKCHNMLSPPKFRAVFLV